MKSFYIILAITLLGSVGCKDKQAELCEGVICENNGECINGDCDCPEGYEGPSCGSQTTPSRITINSITVTKWPAFDENGRAWDPSSTPDIYIKVLRGSSEIHVQPTRWDDPSVNQVLRYVPSSPIDITSVNDRHSIVLWNYDTFDADDYMGGISNLFYQNSNDFPETLNWSFGEYAFTIDVSYYW